MLTSSVPCTVGLVPSVRSLGPKYLAGGHACEAGHGFSVIAANRPNCCEIRETKHAEVFVGMVPIRWLES